MENELIFVGYQTKNGKNGKPFYKLDFITLPIIVKEEVCSFIKSVSIFTEKDKYNSFLKENSLLDRVSIPYNVNGDVVRYYI